MNISLGKRWPDYRVGERLPMGYASAWYDYWHSERVLYPIPLHIWVNLWHRFCARMQVRYRPSILEEAYFRGEIEERARLSPYLMTTADKAELQSLRDGWRRLQEKLRVAEGKGG